MNYIFFVDFNFLFKTLWHISNSWSSMHSFNQLNLIQYPIPKNKFIANYMRLCDSNPPFAFEWLHNAACLRYAGTILVELFTKKELSDRTDSVQAIPRKEHLNWVKEYTIIVYIISCFLKTRLNVSYYQNKVNNMWAGSYVTTAVKKTKL